MVDKIVVLSDGTSNSSTRGEKTNVWRIFEALEPSSTQVAMYDDGVGTSSNKYLAMLGAVFGWGLKRNIIDLYCFICRHYPHINDEVGAPIAGAMRPEIYGFGFSRGSYTIRSLVAFIENQGLISFRSEAELRRNATWAYRRYRSESFPATKMNCFGRVVVGSARWLRDFILQSEKNYGPIRRETTVRGRAVAYGEIGKSFPDKGVRIKFLGLFDTVEAYGMPIAELKMGIDRYLWPMSFCDLDLPKLVDQARHALALDEERATFQPYQWDEELESHMVVKGQVAAGRLKQMWFAGVHSNVGGSYPEDQLAYVPLEWIMHEAMAQGLQLNVAAVTDIEQQKSPLARMYDSRSGLGVLWRYGPRGTNNYAPRGDHRADFYDKAPGGGRGAPRRNKNIRLDANGVRIRPVIHYSVLTRIAFDDGYASAVLPSAFWLMAPNGVLQAVEPTAGRVALDNTKPDKNFGASRKGKDPALLVSEQADLTRALGHISAQSDMARRLVWDTIWWKRILAAIVAILTAFIAMYPWIGGGLIGGVFMLLRPANWLAEQFNFDLKADWEHWISTYDGVARGPFSFLADLFSFVIPSYATPWVNAFLSNSVELGILICCLLAAVAGGNLLQTRVRDRARVGWSRELKQDYIQATVESDARLRDRFKYLTLIAAAAFVVAPGISWIIDRFGADPGAQKPVGRLIVSSIGIWEGAVLTIILALAWKWRSAAHEKLLADVKTTAAQNVDYLPSTNLLDKANAWRNYQPALSAYQLFANELIPFLFAMLVILLGVFGVNKLAVLGLGSAGRYCSPTLKADANGVESLQTVAKPFDAANPCWATGVKLLAGRQYEITLRNPASDWFDRTLQADMGGVWQTPVAHVLAWPLKRWLSQPYFQPIARIGSLGDDEHVLTPVRAFDPIKAPLPECLSETFGVDKAGKIDAAGKARLQDCAPVAADRQILRSRIKPKSDGELFLYVNDAAPFFNIGFFYGNNSGSAIVNIERIDD